jgi:AcrR family transcriptional regulator
MTVMRDTLKGLREKERETRKNIILDAAERLFATKPYDSVSMLEIADEAGLAKSSIYTYFPTQETLFVEAAMRDAGMLFQNLEDILAEEDTPDLGKIIDTFLDFFAARDAFFRMSAQFMLYGNISEASMQKLNPVTRRMLDILDRVFVRRDYKGNVRLLSHTLFASMSGILISYRKYPGRSEEDILRHMNRIAEQVKEMIEVFLRQGSSDKSLR